MGIRETSRIVILDSRKWKVSKFDAWAGSYIAIKLFSKLSNVAMAVVSGQVGDGAVVAMAIANELGSIPRVEFQEIQQLCLSTVKEIKEIGGKDLESPVWLSDGRWGVENLEDDALLVMSLVSHALIYNMTSFFDESRLKASIESFQGLIPSGAVI